jgi:hypothetical protein
VQAWSKILN